MNQNSVRVCGQSLPGTDAGHHFRKGNYKIFPNVELLIRFGLVIKNTHLTIRSIFIIHIYWVEGGGGVVFHINPNFGFRNIIEEKLNDQ